MSHGILNQTVPPVFSDDRGDIFDLIEDKVGHVGMITFKKGAVRGNHYHKKSTQYSFVLDGEIKMTLTDVDGSNARETILKSGSLSKILPLTVHTYEALSDARMLDVTTLGRTDDGYEKDTIRISRS